MTSLTNEVKLDSELESFRQKWLSDLKTRNEHEHEHEHESHDAQTFAGPSRRRPSHNGPPVSTAAKKPRQAEDDADWFQGRSFDEPPSSSHEVKEKGKTVEKNLISALDHYEEAMVKEAQGNMGDSLKLYRKAYRVFLLFHNLYSYVLTSCSLIPVLTGHIARSTSQRARHLSLWLINDPRHSLPPPSQNLPRQKLQSRNSPSRISSPASRT